jgi:NADH-quinone oxidoreductase subunit F
MDNIIFKNKGVPDLQNIDVYSGLGGYSALKKALSLTPADIISLVDESGLRGRGGAGFPAGAKWRLLSKYRVKTVYLICNADEGEPGTFKDRYVMEFDPHLLLEGMAIAAYATGAHHGFIYIRGEYNWIAKVLVKAIEEAQTRGFLGSNVMGTGYSFYIDVFRGAGSYVCGEETALIESLEGKAGRPRLKPPFPAASGLYGEPTVIHNVTTLSYIPFIVENGPGVYKSIGELTSGGTALFSISGHVNKPGLYEYPMGTPLRELIYEAAGGIRGGKNLKAVIPGGLSSPVLRSDEIDVAMDYQSLNAIGTMLGSGGIIVLDEDTSIPLVTRKTARFFAHESCGQCAPCREGTNMVRHLVDMIVSGNGSAHNIEQILRLCRNIRGSTICAFGIAATLPVEAMIRKFSKEFEALLRD